MRTGTYITLKRPITVLIEYFMIPSESGIHRLLLWGEASIRFTRCAARQSDPISLQALPQTIGSG